MCNHADSNGKLKGCKTLNSGGPDYSKGYRELDPYRFSTSKSCGKAESVPWIFVMVVEARMVGYLGFT